MPLNLQTGASTTNSVKPRRSGQNVARRIVPQIARAGRIWLAIFIGILLLGLFKRINLLTLLACPMIMLGVGHFLFAGWGIYRLKGRRRISGPLFAGSPIDVVIALANDGRRAVRAFTLFDQAPGEPSAWFESCLKRGQEKYIRLQTKPLERGAYIWGPLSASCSAPLGLSERRHELAPGREIVVFPRLGRLDWQKFQRWLIGNSQNIREFRQRAKRRFNAQTEFHGLRAFRSGDSPKWIHWRTTARRGELMVREFEETPGNHLILVVDPHGPAGTEPRHKGWEDLLSFAATICWESRSRSENQIYLGVADAAMSVQICDASSCEDLLARLARANLSPRDFHAELIQRLQSTRLPSGPLIVLGLESQTLGQSLSERLGRPAISWTPHDLTDLDFYDAPENSAATPSKNKPGDFASKTLIDRNALMPATFLK